MAQNDIIVFIGTSIFCGLVFVSLGIWAFVRKTPMHFWAGSTVLPETITNVKKYNRANGLMWIIAALQFFIAPVIAYFDFNLAMSIFSIAVPLTVVLLIIAFLIIQRHFSVVK